MRSSRAPGTSAQGNLLSPLHVFSLFYIKFRQVHVDGKQSLSVIEHDTIAFEKEHLRQQHGSGVERGHRRARGYAEVESLMNTLHLAIKDAGSSKNVRDRRSHGRKKIAQPFAFRAHLPKHTLLDR